MVNWRYGDNFFATLDDMQGIERSKIVEVMVEVLTGLDQQITARELHALRVGDGSNAPNRVGPNGESLWRVSMQVNTPQARRLHYMRANDGSVEFTSVRLHDDFKT
jgi:hypothetical protein